MRQKSSFPDKLTGNYAQDLDILDRALRVRESFDIVGRDLVFAGRQAKLYLIDGFAKDAIMLKIITTLTAIQEGDLEKFPDTKSFSDRYIPYLEVSLETKVSTVIDQVLSGPLALIVQGYPEAIMIDARTYPTRSLQEPDSDRVLRGARDSFAETLVINTALIRRHIRDSRLTMQYHSVGSVSKTDVVLAYLEGRADPETVQGLAKKIDALDVKTLSMGQESLSECLIPKRWYNPFPRVRYTERPDTAAATICEGGIVLIVDGTPSIMLLPSSFFDFFQDTNDYYFPPLVGSYLRLTRYLIYLLTLFLIPVWFLMVKNPQLIPPWLSFIQVEKPNDVPIFFQLLVVELVIDCLKQASLNTPAALGGSFSVVSALILGEFAVTARWFVPEVLLYMAFVAVANFAQPSFELGYAFKLCRVALIILVQLFNLWGFVAGVILIAVLIATTPTVLGKNYLYPLIPFDGSRMLRLFVRRSMHDDNT